VRRQGTRHRRCGLPSDDRGGDVRIDHHHGHELRGALTPIGVMLRQELLVLLVRDRRATEAVGNRHRTRAHPPAAPAPPTTAAPTIEARRPASQPRQGSSGTSPHRPAPLPPVSDRPPRRSRDWSKLSDQNLGCSGPMHRATAFPAGGTTDAPGTS